ncbi:hypothetical protein KKF91_09180 [Myxococcota bacterium]|nr:hypothetical protein [Myxococcota bacterium]
MSVTLCDLKRQMGLSYDNTPPKAGLEIAPLTWATPDEALTALRDFAKAGATGWCSYTDTVITVSRAEDLRAGWVLNAELAHGSRTLSLRHTGEGFSGAWITRKAGEAYWVQTHDLRAVYPGAQPGGWDVRYEVYWATQLPSENEAIVGPKITRFCGFREG